MDIFLLLNGLGVVFLLYALANFRKEERRLKITVRPRESHFVRRDDSRIIVMPHRISQHAQGGPTKILSQPRERGLPGGQVHQGRESTANHVPTGRFSTR